MVPPSASDPAPRAPRRRAPFVFGAILLAAGGAFGGNYVLHRGVESTDDAQVEGHIMNVAARTSGQVVRVLVRDNQTVHEGDVLVELDRADLEARLEVTQADTESAQASLDSAQANLELAERTVDANLQQARGGIEQSVGTLRSSHVAISQARADVTAAESRKNLAATELTRVRNLLAEGAVAQAEFDTRQSQYDQAEAALEVARARLEAASTGVTSSNGALEAARGRLTAAQAGPQQVAAARAALSLARARLHQAQAAQHVAELNLSYATVRAPASGVVSRRTVEVGQAVGPDRALLALVPLDDVWVVANFKEDQVAAMRAGQPATISVDTFGSRELHGHVESLASASGARFALLPPDNASGNFVKVVQRIPVLIRLDGNAGVALRPGMSADVTVSTGAR